MVLKLVLLPIHSFWRRKSYMVLKPGGWTTGLEEDKIAGFSSWMCGVPDSPTGLRGIELQSSQTRRVSAYVPDMVWKKWNRREENGIKCCFIFSREVKAKLQGSQEYRPPPKPMVIWKEIELQWHGTQTSYWQRAIWKRIKLQGSQTSCRSLIRA